MVFAALAHQVRRHIVVLLSNSGGELPSGYLASRFRHSWPTTTRHLNILENAGIIAVRREGRGSHYSVNRARLQHVVGGWLRHLTPIGPEQTWTPSGPRSTSELAAAAKRQPSARRPGKKHPDQSPRSTRKDPP